MTGEDLKRIGLTPAEIQEGAYRVNLTDLSQSLAIIEGLSKEYSIHPRVRSLVASLISTCSERDYDCYIHKIVSFIKKKVKYVNDPPKTEVFQSPLATLRYGMGDCDDHAILAAALLRAAGFRVKVVLGAPSGERYDHVYVKVFHPHKGWLTIDTTTSNPMEEKMYPEMEVFTLGEEPEEVYDVELEVPEEIHEVEGEEPEEIYELGRPFSGRRWILRRHGRRLYRELWLYRNGRRIRLLRRVPYRHPLRLIAPRRIVHRRHPRLIAPHRPARAGLTAALPLLLVGGGLLYFLRRK
jgi:hypothetical protein